MLLFIYNNIQRPPTHKRTDVLIFFTGASRIPPLGFPKSPTLNFSEENIYPTASTCALILTIPQDMVLIMNPSRELYMLASNSIEDSEICDFYNSTGTMYRLGLR